MLLCDKTKKFPTMILLKINAAAQVQVFQWTNAFPTPLNNEAYPLSQKETKASGEWRLKGLLRWSKGVGEDKRGQ